MAKDKGDPIRDAVLEAVEVALDAQLRAVRRLRKGESAQPVRERSKSRSQIDLVEDILAKAGGALHINDILAAIARTHRVELDRESVVSALTKKVQRGDRFVRTGPNEFALKAKGTQ